MNMTPEGIPQNGIDTSDSENMPGGTFELSAVMQQLRESGNTVGMTEAEIQHMAQEIINGGTH